MTRPPSVPRRGRRRLLRLGFEIVALAVGIHLLLTQLAGLERTAEQLARATWWLLLTVVVLEAASLLAYGELILTGFRRAGAPVSRGLVQRAVLVGTSLGRTLPAGNAAAFAVVVAAFRGAGVEGVVAGTVMATSGLLSSAVLAALLPVGVILTLTTGRLTGIALSAVVAAGLVLIAATLAPVAVRRPRALADRVERVLVPLTRGPLRHRLHPDAVATLVERGATGVRALARDRRALRVASGWAALNWLLDIAVVVVLATTIGAGTPPASILLAYLIAQLAASLPLTPGGVGIVETAMIGSLVAAGAPVAAATTTVLGWQLVSHWLPILVGLALLPTVSSHHPPGDGREREPRP
jgi:uncharacterized protein (TIRG00374 family)